MATAYLYFGKPVNADTVTALIQVCRVLLSEKDASGTHLWDHFHLEIASGGGDIMYGFSGYNVLSDLPIKLTTHNCGAVDSAAIMLFLAGSIRTACSFSSFHFHQSAWTFSGPGQPINTISDANKWLERYEYMMAKCIADKTSIPKAEALSMMQKGTNIIPEDAKKHGLIDDVKDSPYPRDAARSWQI